MIAQEKSKIKIDLKLADDFLLLKTMDTNAVVQKLEDNMKLREMPIEKHIKKEIDQI
jgi:hypothetical protein